MFLRNDSELLITRHHIPENSSLYFTAILSSTSKAWTIVARSDVGIVDSNPTQGMDIWCVYAFILYLCCPVFR
jgi:hypothetical protein